MLKNHLKIAFRSLRSHKSHALINISGLAVGISVCLIIFIVIRFELSFDNYHQKRERIYRVLTEFHHPNTPAFTNKSTPAPLPQFLKSSLSQIEKAAPVYAESNAQLMLLDENGGNSTGFMEETGVFFTDSALFEILDFNWLTGTPSTLDNRNTVVLSKGTAEKYFGTWQNAVGQKIKWNNSEILEVTGVLDEIPKNSDLQFKVVISMGTGYTSEFLTTDDWDSTSSNFGTFVLLNENAAVAAVNEQLQNLAKEKKSEGNLDTHFLQPLSEVHYDTQAGNFSGSTISPQLVNVLWLIAALILLIACVNFINLSTAQAVNRFKEVGVRKVLGSNKTQLKIQFLTETFLMVIVAILLSVAVVSLSLNYWGVLFNLPLDITLLLTPEILLFFTLIAVLVTLLAGFYPSLVISRFSPAAALKSKFHGSAVKGVSLRRGLVVFQFAIAQILIIGTIIMVRQMDFFMNQPLGFEKDAVINVPIPRDSISLGRVDYLRNRLSTVNGIQKVSFSFGAPISNGNWWTNFQFDNAADETDFFVICKSIDHEYLSTYEMSLVAGRNVHDSKDVKEFLVNEALVKKLGYSNPEEVLNKEINLGGDEVVGSIVGVLKDFNARSLKWELDPVLMATEQAWYDRAGIKLASNDPLSTVETIKGIWEEVFPDHIFQYDFLDTQVASYYEQEKRLANMYKISAALAIFLSCLGLYGLASFLVAQRTKEAGIRKVLGATKQSIIYLFSKEFVLLIGVAFCIAAPIAGYLMQQWLENYPYAITMGWSIFFLGGSLTMAIAFSTIGYQAIKVANNNPVKSLRTE